MGKIKVTRNEIEGLAVIEPTVFRDERGYFVETYNENDMKEAGLDLRFVQDNQSMSRKGVLRGLHFQKQYPQGKLVRVLQGRVFDVAVDLRSNSPTFGKWFGVDVAVFAYKCTDFYHPGDEGGMKWDDPEIGIEWPLDGEPLLSEKDQKWLGIRDTFHFGG